MALLEPGSVAPDFEAQDQEGEPWSLADLRGKPVVLYFYPMDDTPGCTAEACGFRDEAAARERAGAVVLGVSTQDAASHRRFAAKHRLDFPLLVDRGKRICKAYGALGLTGLAKRVTYLIGPDGRVARVWGTVDARHHSQEVLAAVQALGQPA